MRTTQAVLFTFILTTTASPVPNDREHVDLYLPEDDVQVLTIDDFKENIENSSRAWLVEFYASWCGNCQRFAPSWKAFATDIFAWRDLVQVGAVACSNEINTPICREYEIGRYPTVKYFHENYQTTSEDLGMVIHKTEGNIELGRHHVIEKIISEIYQGRGAMYPNLLPYTNSDLSELLESMSVSYQYIFLVVQPSGSYLGAEVALDLHKTPEIVIRYAFSNNSDLVKDLPIEKFPRVVVLDRNHNIEAIPGVPNNTEELKKAIGTFLTYKGIKIVEDVSPKKNSTDVLPDPKEKARTRLRDRIKKMGDVVFQIDLEAAVRYSLKQEVSNTKIIEGDKLKALVMYLEVLEKYFPFSHRASPFLSELTSFATNSTQIEGWKISEIVKLAEEKQVFSSPQRFLGCEGSKSRFRGFPCSLWKLFHFLTVNSAQEDKPTEILEAMLGYVKNFFSCAACSEHFQEMASRRNMSSVSSLNSAILWLWEAHNEVNERLAGDVTEDPEFPKRQFPGKEACPLCVNSDSSWNTEEVVKYLKGMYGRFNVRYIGSDTRLLFPALE